MIIIAPQFEVGGAGIELLLAVAFLQLLGNLWLRSSRPRFRRPWRLSRVAVGDCARGRQRHHSGGRRKVWRFTDAWRFSNVLLSSDALQRTHWRWRSNSVRGLVKNPPARTVENAAFSAWRSISRPERIETGPRTPLQTFCGAMVLTLLHAGPALVPTRPAFVKQRADLRPRTFASRHSLRLVRNWSLWESGGVRLSSIWSALPDSFRALSQPVRLGRGTFNHVHGRHSPRGPIGQRPTSSRAQVPQNDDAR